MGRDEGGGNHSIIYDTTQDHKNDMEWNTQDIYNSTYGSGW